MLLTHATRGFSSIRRVTLGKLDESRATAVFQTARANLTSDVTRREVLLDAAGERGHRGGKVGRGQFFFLLSL